MKVYIAGIKVNNNYPDESTIDKTTHVINLLNLIYKDAKISLGEDAVVIVILQEYALTPKAIPVDDKKLSIKAFREALAAYKNMILIPGSYSAYEKYAMDERGVRKLEKLDDNFKNIVKRGIVSDTLFTRIFSKHERAKQAEQVLNYTYIKNTAYIMTALQKYHHIKAAPIVEEYMYPGKVKGNVRYYIGKDDFIKHVSINDLSLDAGIFICYEHAKMNYDALLKHENPPLLHVIVSASIQMNDNKLIGALTVQMDKTNGLVVVKSNKHHRASEIETVVANIYEVGMSGIAQSVCVRNIDEPVLPEKTATTTGLNPDSKPSALFM